MTKFIFLSKGNQDEYINMLARSAGQEPTDTDFFDYKYDVLMDEMTPVMRGILKYKIMQIFTMWILAMLATTSAS